MATVNFYYRSTKKKAPLTIRFLYRDYSTPSTVKVRKSKESKEVPYTDVTLNAKIELEVTKEYWETQNKRGVSGTNKNLKPEIDKKLLSIENHLLESFKNDKEIISINSDWLNKELEKYYNPKKIDPKAKYLSYWIDYIIDNADNIETSKNTVGLSKNTIKGYNDIRNVIKRYQDFETTKIKSLNKDWFNDFFEWLKINEKYSHNTAVKKVSILKTVINKASKKVETANDLDKLEIKTVNTYDEDTDVITLTLEDIQKIQNYNFESKAFLNARKWLLLAIYTGQRGNDLLNGMIKENFKKDGDNYKIELKQIKTGKKVVIPVLPAVKEIYKNGLPYKVSQQKLNKHFKDICKLAEIDNLILGKLRNKKTNRLEKKLRPKYEYISTHTGRRTFATLHFNELPHQSIMKVTGHKKYATFLQYVQKESEEHLDTFNDYYKKLEDKKETQFTVIKNASNQ
ncbi:tyrosine-type recombinase/integrase [Psychroserpens damuponensis]|uniref:tyrosine-type recombinase/integrase n=1 Tax=Psychroserpens damuponensis TaxID=943936 RepID=UPI00058E95F2|nr:phage integrase SAM-like domain-containing protein [Psychroserpens damuponensis]